MARLTLKRHAKSRRERRVVEVGGDMVGGMGGLIFERGGEGGLGNRIQRF